jgi:hypothetical protein
MAQEQAKTGASANPSAVKISCGISNTSVYGVGKTVADLRGQCKKALNIDPTMKALVDGITVEDESTFVLQEGQELEFVKLAGQKGDF